MKPINARVLEILVCPAPDCRKKLELEGRALACTGCARRYRLEERWAVLIPEEGELPSSPPAEMDP